MIARDYVVDVSSNYMVILGPSAQGLILKILMFGPRLTIFW